MRTARLLRFLSTPSARRATRCPSVCCRPMQYFYPRPPRGGRPAKGGRFKGLLDISIHALREEGDWPRSPRSRGSWTLLSTPSARRATRGHPHTQSADSNFYPRPPRGGRPLCPGCTRQSVMIRFLSTPSARRATSCPCTRSRHPDYFYPRPPRGGRPCTGLPAFRPMRFLSTPSARRAMLATWQTCFQQGNFYPRPPRGGRPVALVHMGFGPPISIHALHEEGD